MQQNFWVGEEVVHTSRVSTDSEAEVEWWVNSTSTVDEYIMFVGLF